MSVLTPSQAEWMLPAAERDEPAGSARGRWFARLRYSVYPWLFLIGCLQVRDALHIKEVPTPFEDEGLYVYMGHKMIAHYLHGTFVTDYPGSYFSGAPGLYPVLSAMGDSVDGLNGARDVSTIFAIIAMIAVCGIGVQLFGKVAGVVGAAVFSINGNIIFLSHFATYDMCMLSFVALATWLALWSAQRNMFLWAPAVAALLMIAFMAKYAGAVYIPIVAFLVIASNWPRYRWFVVRQGITLCVLTTATILAVLGLLGRSMYQGIQYTTFERHTFSYQSTGEMANQAYHWVGPWMIAAAVALVVLVATKRLTWLLAVALAFASIAVIVQQIRIHEAVSYSKHVSFGLVFASPVIGGAFALLIAHRQRWLRPVGVVLTAAFAGYFLFPAGQVSARQNMTFWPDDTAVYSVVHKYYDDFPTKAILGESPSPERYELRYDVPEKLWNTTYAMTYHFPHSKRELHGRAAYRQALLTGHFGVVYLTSTTNYGGFAQALINEHKTVYRLRAKIPRTIRGKPAGAWLVYSLPLPSDR